MSEGEAILKAWAFWDYRSIEDWAKTIVLVEIDRTAKS